MPKGKISSKAQSKRKTAVVEIPSSPDTIDEEDDLYQKFEYNNKTAITNKEACGSDQENAVERSFEALPEGEIGNEMTKMLEMFESDMNKTMLAKRKRMEKFTNAAINVNQAKIKEVWDSQHKTRNNLIHAFGNNIDEILSQWDTDFAHQKEQEEKVQRILQQQAKVIEQARTIQLQRLDSLRKIQLSFTEGIEKLEEKHNQQMESIKDDMKQEMLLLQKRSLMENQQQEMQNVRKSLQTIFLP